MKYIPVTQLLLQLQQYNMAQLIYQINTGVPNFTASINPVMKPNQIHSSLGVYSFDDIPNGVYSLTVVDANGCIAFIDNIVLEGTTTTTTSSSTTSTTTSSTSTTTTTTEQPIVTVKFGLLYNWYAATDANNIANIGWHLPTRFEYQNLGTYLGGTVVAGGKMKETGTTYWNSPNTGADNSSGFNGRGSGRRSSASGTFLDELVETQFWTSSAYDATSAYYYTLFASSASLGIQNQNHKVGNPIRLVKDTTSLINGQTGTYIGNDGKKYRTICIDTQEWVADNLFETKYRNGSTIPEVTDNTAWTVLTTGALCAYNNDWLNV